MYADLAAELTGTIPGLSPLLAATHIRRAWRDIRNERNWSFKTSQASLVCPAIISAGTASWSETGTVVRLDATAEAALTPYFTFPPYVTQLQIRLGPPWGPLYRIMFAPQVTPLDLTLDRRITEPTTVGGQYMIYRAYFSPPVPDFQRWDSFEEFTTGTTLSGNRITGTSVDFDRSDPSRTSFGTPMYVKARVADPTGLTMYEFWPHPGTEYTWLVTYKRTGPEFNLPTSVQPDIIPDQLIMVRALGWYAYPWAQANRGRFPGLQKTDYMPLVVTARQQYKDDLREIELQDDDRALESVYNRGHWGGGRERLISPIGDARYWQEHPITW